MRRPGSRYCDPPGPCRRDIPWPCVDKALFVLVLAVATCVKRTCVLDTTKFQNSNCSARPHQFYSVTLYCVYTHFARTVTVQYYSRSTLVLARIRGISCRLEEGISQVPHRAQPGEPSFASCRLSRDTPTLAALVPDLGDGAEAHAEAAGVEEEEDGRVVVTREHADAGV